MKRFLVAWLVGVAGVVVQAQAFAQDSPTQFVREGVDQVLATVMDQSLEPGVRRSTLNSLIARRFDFERMGQSILATNWRRATPGQRARFKELFQVLLGNTYVAAIESYTSEKVNVGGERIKGDRATVIVTIVTLKGTEVPLMFKLINSGGIWGAYDVIIEGVSLVSNYRSSFQKIVRTEGMDGLLKQLEDKVAGSPQA